MHKFLLLTVFSASLLFYSFHAHAMTCTMPGCSCSMENGVCTCASLGATDACAKIQSATSGIIISETVTVGLLPASFALAFLVVGCALAVFKKTYASLVLGVPYKPPQLAFN